MGIMRFGRGARKDSGEEIRAGKTPEHGGQKEQRAEKKVIVNAPASAT